MAQRLQPFIFMITTTKKPVYLALAARCVVAWVVAIGCSQPSPTSAPASERKDEPEPKRAETKSASTTTPSPQPPAPPTPEPTAPPDAGTNTTPTTCAACPVGSVCLPTGQCAPLAGDNTCPGGCPSGAICSAGQCIQTGTGPRPNDGQACFDRCVAQTDLHAMRYLQCTEMTCSGFGACDDSCFDQHCGGGNEQSCDHVLAMCQQQCSPSSSGGEPPPFCVWSFCF